MCLFIIMFNTKKSNCKFLFLSPRPSIFLQNVSIWDFLPLRNVFPRVYKMFAASDMQWGICTWNRFFSGIFIIVFSFFLCPPNTLYGLCLMFKNCILYIYKQTKRSYVVVHCSYSRKCLYVIRVFILAGIAFSQEPRSNLKPWAQAPGQALLVGASNILTLRIWTWWCIRPSEHMQLVLTKVRVWEWYIAAAGDCTKLSLNSMVNCPIRLNQLTLVLRMFI